MEKTEIERVRSFNRAVTQRTGALDQSYLGEGRPLGQARLLFEIGPGGADLRALRERLGLDSGYLSRLLRSLDRQRLVTVSQDGQDRRRRRVALTQAGVRAWQAYEGKSDDLARSLLASLGASQRRRLVAAMADVEALLAAAATTIAAEPHDNADANRCLDAYFSELDHRFDGGFDAGKGGGKPVEPVCFLIARQEGVAVGCGVLMRHDASTGEIKRMWVAPGARGTGLSRRLLEALEARARDAGMSRIVLDTNSALSEAQALYDKAGYHRIERYNDNPYAQVWFSKDLR